MARKHGEGTIRKKGKSWYWQMKSGTNPDGSPRYFYAKGKTLKELQENITRQKKLQRIIIEDSELKEQTLEALMWKWFRFVKWSELKPSSYDRLETTLTSNIFPYIGHIPPIKITPNIIQHEIINNLQKKGLSFSTVKKARDALNSFFNYCISNGLLFFNPVQGTVINQKDFITFRCEEDILIEEEDKDVRWLSAEQIPIFKEEALSTYSNGRYRYKNGPIGVFILNTGLRVGEVAALSKKDFNPINKTVKIRGNIVVTKRRDSAGEREKDGNTYIKRKQRSTKTKSGERILYLNQTAYDMIMIYQAYQTSSSPNSPLFPTKKGTYHNPTSLSKSITRIMNAINIEGMAAHSLRHTFASQLFERGVDIKDISELLGHSSVDITYRVYIHLAKDRGKRVIAAVGDI